MQAVEAVDSANQSLSNDELQQLAALKQALEAMGGSEKVEEAKAVPVDGQQAQQLIVSSIKVVTSFKY